MPMARDWMGMSILDKANRACGRATIGIAMEAVRETKLVTHRISGNLSRSVHAAPVGYDGYNVDAGLVEGGTDLMLSHMNFPPTQLPTGPAVEVGSWLPYACVEWVGRGHPGITQGIEVARTKADRYVMQAFREEGL